MSPGPSKEPRAKQRDRGKQLACISITLVLLAVGLMLGCGKQDKPTLSDRQVLQASYEILMQHVDRLQGWGAEAELLDLSFSMALLTSCREALARFNAKPHNSEFPSCNRTALSSGGHHTTVYLGDLQHMVSYLGLHWWAVRLGTEEWRFNEMTREFQPFGDAAKSRLKRYTLTTYQNQKYGYRVAYPPSWALNEGDKSAVLITAPREIGTITIIVIGRPGSPEAAPVFSSLLGDLPRLMDVSLAFQKAFQHDLTLLERSDSLLVYQARPTRGSQLWEVRHHFVFHKDLLYEVVSATELNNPLPPLRFDAFETFAFD